MLIIGCPVETSSFTYILLAEKNMLGEMIFKKRESKRERKKKGRDKTQEKKEKNLFKTAHCI